MTGAEVTTLIDGITDVVSASITGALPLVLAIFGGLVGLGIALHFVRKFIGRRA